MQPIVQSRVEVFTVSAIGMGNEITISHGDEQSAGIIPGFLAAEAQLDTITNTDLPQSIGA